MQRERVTGFPLQSALYGHDSHHGVTSTLEAVRMYNIAGNLKDQKKIFTDKAKRAILSMRAKDASRLGVDLGNRTVRNRLKSRLGVNP